MFIKIVFYVNIEQYINFTMLVNKITYIFTKKIYKPI